MKPDCSEVGGKSRLLAGNAKISDEGQSQAGTDRTPVHGCDNGLARLHEPSGLLVDMARWRHECLTVSLHFQPLFEVSPSAEMLASCRKNNAAALRFRIEQFQFSREPGDQIDVEKVVWRATNFHHRNVPVQADANVFT